MPRRMLAAEFFVLPFLKSSFSSLCGYIEMLCCLFLGIRVFFRECHLFELLLSLGFPYFIGIPVLSVSPTPPTSSGAGGGYVSISSVFLTSLFSCFLFLQFSEEVAKSAIPCHVINSDDGTGGTSLRL